MEYEDAVTGGVQEGMKHPKPPQVPENLASDVKVEPPQETFHEEKPSTKKEEKCLREDLAAANLLRYESPCDSCFHVPLDLILQKVIMLEENSCSQCERSGSRHRFSSEDARNELELPAEMEGEGFVSSFEADFELNAKSERRTSIDSKNCFSRDLPETLSLDVEKPANEEKKIETRAWKWRKGAGAVLASMLAFSEKFPIQFVPRVDGGSRGCVVPTDDFKPKQMYKIMRCAHCYKPSKGVPPCQAKAKILFNIHKGDEGEIMKDVRREVFFIWSKSEKTGKGVGCVHEKGAVAKGITRLLDRERLSGISATASGMTLASVTKSTALRIEAGNRTGTPIVPGTAHQAAFVQARKSYEPKGVLEEDVKDLQEKCVEAHAEADPGMKQGFYGSIHGLQVVDGHFNGLSLFAPQSQEIHFKHLKTRTKNSDYLLMDSTMLRERRLLVSHHSQYARRARRRGTFLPVKKVNQKEYVCVRPLRTYLSIRLETGMRRGRKVQPFVVSEHISVERNVPAIQNCLSTYFDPFIARYGENVLPKIMVTDCDQAYTAAIARYFNKMYVSQYSAALLLSSKRKDEKLRTKLVRTVHVWCSVHADRNVSKYFSGICKASVEANNRGQENAQSVINFGRQLLRIFRVAKTYEDLSFWIGFIQTVLNLQRFPYVRPGTPGQHVKICTAEECKSIGESNMWKGLSPSGHPPKGNISELDVLNASRIGKQQMKKEVEDLYLNDGPDEDESENKDESRDIVVPEEIHSLEETIGHLEHGPASAVKTGVASLDIGGIIIYVVFRALETNEGTTFHRVRIYIPSLSPLGHGIGGLVLMVPESDLQNAVNTVESPVWNKGTTLDYFKNQIFSNAVFLSDALNGTPDITHNTSAENVIRNRKHTDEIGLEMRKRQHGMGLPEYVTRRMKWMEKKNRTVLTIMNAPPLKATRKRRRNVVDMAAVDGMSDVKKLKSQKDVPNATLIDVARNADVLLANDAVIPGVFGSVGTTLIERRGENSRRGDHETSDRHASEVDSGDVDGCFQVEENLPVSQLTPSQLLHTTENWKSNRGNVPMKSKKETATKHRNAFIEKFRKNIETFLTGTVEQWDEKGLKRLSEHMKGRFSSFPGQSAFSIATLRKLLAGTGEYFPKTATRDILLSASVRLEKSTVWDEGELYTTSGRSELTPVAESVVRRVEAGEVVQDLPEAETKKEASYLSLCMEDLRRLVAPQFVESNRSRRSWLNDNVVGGILALYNLKRSNRRPVIFHCPLWLQALCWLNLKSGSDLAGPQIQTLQRENRMTPGRNADGSWGWEDAEEAFFPFNIQNSHWVSIRASRTDRTLVVLDSNVSKGHIQPDAVSQCIETLQVYFMHHKSEHWVGSYEWKGYDLEFPQQENCDDCGVFCLLGCRYASLGLKFAFTQKAVPPYRRRFVHELLVGRAS